MPATPKSKSKSQPKSSSSLSVKNVYRFTVTLIGGPFTLDQGQSEPLRVIDIRGNQTLEKLHEAIFAAFDRDDMHLYEFQLGGKKPMDRAAVSYGIPEYGQGDEKDARATKIEKLNLKVRQTFFYWFDFGDDWMHKIKLDAILPAEAGVKYPVLVKKQGESPPQYPDWEDEDDYEGDEGEVSETDGEVDFGASGLTMVDMENPEQVKEVIMAGLRPARRQPRNDPERLAEIFMAVVAFCVDHLDADYIGPCFKLLLHIDQDTALPLERGAVAGWAAGLVHAIGFVNFLSDPATTPHMPPAGIAKHFGVSQATMSAKSRDIRKALDITQLDPRFSTQAVLAWNPLVWFLPNEDGIILDIRRESREVQEAAFNAGLIPWIPADHPELHGDAQSQPAPDKSTSQPGQKKRSDKIQ